MSNLSISDTLAAARAALGSAPPVGDKAYALFARATAALVEQRWPQIAEANERDLAAGRESGLPEPLLRRIRLTEEHRDATTALAEAVQRELDDAVRPTPGVIGLGGATARRVPKPLGVILMIYEARPTVTIDGTLLPVCAGNAVLMRGGSEIARTSAALGEVFAQALAEAGLPAGLVQIMTTLDRAGLRELLRRDDAIDVLIPRGSPSLIDACRAASRIPMIVGGGGVNHQFVHRSADLDLAVRLVLDGKLPEPEGCTALEMVLLDEEIAVPFLRRLAARGSEPGVGTLALCVGGELAGRLPAEVPAAFDTRPMTEIDDGREFLDTTLAVRAVPGLDAAIAHVERHGSRHTEGIVCGDPAAAEEFCRRVDAAALIVNGSVRLHDGPTLGLGTEIAISTGRLHVRGPVTLRALMTYAWRVEGNGVTRFRPA